LEREEVKEKEEPPDTSETIEKVLARRQGKIGVVGNITTIFMQLRRKEILILTVILMKKRLNF